MNYNYPKLTVIGDMLHDLDHMQECAAQHGGDDEYDPFYLKSSKTMERMAMKMVRLIPDYVFPAGPLARARDASDPVLPGFARSGALKTAAKEQFCVRSSMAFIGGVALLASILVMTFMPGKTVSLITTGVAMVVFAFGITWMTNFSGDKVLALTAAYAAVLVVFVGTKLGK